MPHLLRILCRTLALAFVGFSPAVAQAAAQKYGLCYGIAGNPVTNNFTQVFATSDFGPVRAQFFQYMQKKYPDRFRKELACVSFDTQAEADSFRAKEMEIGRQHPKWPVIELDWTPSAPAPAPAVAIKPPAPPPAAPAPKPAAPAPAPAKPALVASKPGVFVICRSEWNTDLRRFYNPPVDGRGAGYAEWQSSFGAYLVAKHAFKGGTNYGCAKYPTREAAQAGYDAWVTAARASPSINGRPSPIIITDWKY